MGWTLLFFAFLMLLPLAGDERTRDWLWHGGRLGRARKGERRSSRVTRFYSASGLADVAVKERQLFETAP